MRPTPQLGGPERTNSITLSSQLGLHRADSKDELSPRSKMFPKLKEKINTIKGGGSFTKFERNTPVQTVRKDGFAQEHQKVINSQLKKREEAKTPNFGILGTQEIKPKLKEVKPRVVKEEKKEIKPKEEKKEKKEKKPTKKGGKSK